MRVFFFLTISSWVFFLQSQSQALFFNINRAATVTYSNITTDFQLKLWIREMPRPGAEKMNGSYPARALKNLNGPLATVLTIPLLGQSFFANPWGVSTPNDNDMAISDSGMVVSVVNTNIYIKNIATQSVFPNKSLAAFTAPINGRHEEFDPKEIGRAHV